MLTWARHLLFPLVFTHCQHGVEMTITDGESCILLHGQSIYAFAYPEDGFSQYSVQWFDTGEDVVWDIDKCRDLGFGAADGTEYQSITGWDSEKELGSQICFKGRVRVFAMDAE